MKDRNPPKLICTEISLSLQPHEIPMQITHHGMGLVSHYNAYCAIRDEHGKLLTLATGLLHQGRGFKTCKEYISILFQSMQGIHFYFIGTCV